MTECGSGCNCLWIVVYVRSWWVAHGWTTWITAWQYAVIQNIHNLCFWAMSAGVRYMHAISWGSPCCKNITVNKASKFFKMFPDVNLLVSICWLCICNSYEALKKKKKKSACILAIDTFSDHIHITLQEMLWWGKCHMVLLSYVILYSSPIPHPWPDNV